MVLGFICKYPPIIAKGEELSRKHEMHSPHYLFVVATITDHVDVEGVISM